MSYGIIFYGAFTASKTGKTGLTVTVDVYQVTRSSGAIAQVVTSGSATETGGGAYQYRYASGDLSTYDYVAWFKTADATVDAQQVPSLWSHFSINDVAALANLDATVSSRADGAYYTSTRAGYLDTLSGLVTAIWSAATRTLTAIADSAGVTTLLARLTSGRAGNLDNLDSPVSGVAGAVWDVAAAGHQSVGSTGKLLSTAGSASDPLLNAVPGSYPSGTAGYALGRLTSTSITVTSPLDVKQTFNLVAGDDYYAADGRSFDIGSASWSGFTGGTVTMTVWGKATVVIAGSVLSDSSFRIEMSSAQTSAIGTGAFEYVIEVRPVNTHHITRVHGTVVVVRGANA